MTGADFTEADSRRMQRALELAAHARDAEGEVPVGAVLVHEEKIVGEGWNRNITLNDPSAHAEIGALRDAGQRLGNHRIEVQGGLLAGEAGRLLRDFFRARR